MHVHTCTDAPRLPTVSVSPSAEIVEGISVNLTCSSDANPTANYTWYKDNKVLPAGTQDVYRFVSISSEDSGNYFCKCRNLYGQANSMSLSIDRKFLCKNPCEKEGNIFIDTTNDKVQNGRYSIEDTKGSAFELQATIRHLTKSDTGQYRPDSLRLNSPRDGWRLTGTRDSSHERKQHEQSTAPDAPKLPSVSVSPSAEIVEGSSVTLTCSSDANPAASYTWYKEDVINPLSYQNQHVFSSILPSDSGKYYCTADNNLGQKRSESRTIDVKYAPKLPSVSVSPSAEIVEGSSVTLTCSSDANPAASYTWYKEDVINPLSYQNQHVFSSILPSDSGKYYCTADNNLGQKRSESKTIDVKYAPKLPSVSVSPSAEIVEGSSVTLTCSSDANPAANYTWYKEDENLPKAFGQNFTVTKFRPEHSGSYYCVAQNKLGRHNSTLQQTIVPAFDNIVEEYGIGHKISYILTDNPSNMKRAFKVRMPEVEHPEGDSRDDLDDETIDGMKEVKAIARAKASKFTTLRHSSSKHKDLFEAHFGSNKSIPAANNIRWNSTYRQLKALIRLDHRAITEMCSDTENLVFSA
ncbi:B-cell receptor CD22-like [Pelmatolapia mariae]|uniref:B-cell receptor CD22-like n=1 Tax=Pelmatolapia mariae TaxID=158779 RepID=UPI002FE6274A